jgi:hypothetical protein
MYINFDVYFCENILKIQGQRKWTGYLFMFYLFNAKLDATTLVQKHKIVVLRKQYTASGSSSLRERGGCCARFLFAFPF